jgi:hypothetical protein
MKKSMVGICLVPLALAFGGEKKISLFTAFDLGLVAKGYDLQKKYDPSGEALNRTYVDVGYTEQLDEAFLISVGVGGIFWKAFEGIGGGPQDKVIKFGPGISNAYMKWTPNHALGLTFGYFPYKYNTPAKNLGEYLFRTEAYPTILYTGGWSWMNSVGYNTVGAMLSWNIGDGFFKQDIGLFGEYFNAPIYDITPAYIATLKPMAGITIGGAASLHRFISPTPQTKKELTKEHLYHKNFYFPEVTAKRRYNVGIDKYPGESFHDLQWKTSAGTANEDSLKQAIFDAEKDLLAIYGYTTPQSIPLTIDTNKSTQREGRAPERATKLRADIKQQASAEGSDTATYFNDSNNVGNKPLPVSFDLAAVKALAFFEIDFNAILGLDAGKMGEFNLYGEVAQLGFKNYPIFYTENSQRRPMMLGFSVPTFGILNNLSFEVEYLKNPNIASIASTYDKLELPPDAEFRYKVYNKDDYKWSLHASRGLSKFLTIYLQVANDHMRLKDGNARPEFVPLTHEPGHWYWLTRIQWMI